mmetsp:Transcript_10582/g.25243  ORF Transcript_10582/g.25243 Transcript_10582/m.25243 type:complete len:360 (-) Transcript_10582:371-1450(-)|eukprot:CAMPEP_0113461008 /NCGR_PEP_ID=MMETSP0014_2-20120614/11301_1 /TAXON_ID=2857 /ORGANISM="Nitzschia sp." /LENGTH=359 /DNA_ID=CAMNT_0000352719 /DNA_START=833 /DNA_END=1912 /DNA_ORIENTATION=- /assembly_acc=CAM_ASM_000159
MIRRLKERCRSDTPTDEEGTAPTTAVATAVSAVQPAMEKKMRASVQMASDEGMKIGSSKSDEGATDGDSKLGGGRDISSGEQGDAVSQSADEGQPELVPVKLTGRDILLGRGRTIQELPSNIHFRKLVSSYRTRYDKVKRNEKRVLVHKIINILRSEGYRFCKRIGDDVGDVDSNKKLAEYLWVLADPEEVYKKISHNLRSTRRSSDSERNDSKRPSKVTEAAKKAHRGKEKQQSDIDSFLSSSSPSQFWFETAASATGAGSVSSVRSSREDRLSVTSNAAIERAVSELNAGYGISLDRASASSASLDGGQDLELAERTSMPAEFSDLEERGGHKRIFKTEDEEGTKRNESYKETRKKE